MKIIFIVKAIDFIDPQGIMLLSALAKEKGHVCHLLIANRENIAETINSINPDVIAFSASTGEHKYYMHINRYIKKKYPSMFTVIGGPHVTFYPDSFYEGNFDAACKGEGEGAWIELLEALGKGQQVDDIKNIITRKKNNELRPLVDDLNILPMPDRELFYEKTEMGNFPIKSFMSSRGCPFPCAYCFNHSSRNMYKVLGKYIRRVSVDYLFREIKHVVSKYPLQFIKFYDDIFAYPNDEWLVEFVQRYPEEIGIPFHCATRPDLVDEKMVSLLKKAGCHSINMSIEAGNEVFRKKLLKRDMGDHEIINAFSLFHKAAIKIFSNSIFGLPYSKIANDIETLDLNLKCKVDFAEFPIYHPYPKTELGEYCIREKIFEPNYESLHMSYQNKSPLTCFSAKEKDVQKNLSLLASLVIILPWTRGIVINKLIYWNYPKIYFMIYLLIKTYLIKTKIYPFRLGKGDFLGLFKKAFKVDYFKHTDEAFNESGEPWPADLN